MRDAAFTIPSTLDGSHLVANSIRCSILDFVETFTITEVVVHKNQSVMTDEQLAHRLGMIVLDSSSPPPDRVYLDATAPPGDRLCVSSELLRHANGDTLESPGDDKIPLVMLGPSESISLECKIAKKNGRAHARHCPAAVVRFKPQRDKSVVLEIEPTGALDPHEVFDQACTQLDARLARAAVKLGAARA
jgi:DNA-directed RNA polymerase subunit D